MRKRQKILLILLFCFLRCLAEALAQSELKHIRQGNRLYEKAKYPEAEEKYSSALEKNGKSYQGAFNLGTALYRQKKFNEAAGQYEMLSHRKTDEKTLAKSYHNLGNALLQEKKYRESIEAYKHALRANPGDMDTKYNLSYAQALLQRKEQKQNQQQKDQQEQQQEKERQNQQQNQRDNQEQQQQQQNEQKQQSEQQQAQPQQTMPGQLSKEDAERLLEAIRNADMSVQEKLKKERKVGVKVKTEKDW